jgi:signal transduction histidine kinase
MMAAASHEFRNPLAGIMSMLTMIEGGINQEFKNYLDIAKTSADLLLYLANDMLDYAQIEAGKLKLHFEKFYPLKIIEELVELMRFKAISKGISLSLLPDPLLKKFMIKSDENRFK